MNKRIKIILCSVVALFGFLAPVMAANNVMAAPQTYFNWGLDCEDANGNKQDDIVCLILTIYNWISIGVGVVVVIGLIIGGIMYSTAQGDQAQAKKGIDQMRNALIALGLYFFLWALLNFLVPGGLFTTNDKGEVVPKTSYNYNITKVIENVG